MKTAAKLCSTESGINPNRYYRTGEIAVYLGVCCQTVGRWYKDAGLKRTKVSSQTQRVLGKNLMAWLERHTEKNESDADL
jgi:hypothetical protein